MTTNTVNLPNIAGPDLLCSPGTYTLQNLPAGSTATWSVIPASQFVNGSGTGTSAFMELSGNYTGIRPPRIVFTISTACGDIQVDKTFWIGPPQVTYHPPGIDPCTRQSLLFYDKCPRTYLQLVCGQSQCMADQQWAIDHFSTFL